MLFCSRLYLLSFFLSGYVLFADSVPADFNASGSEAVPMTSIVGVYGCLIFFAILTGYILWRKGNLRLVSGEEKKLKICENRVVGPKQCLLVVEYEGEKMLLGVSPGIIQHLCFLGMNRDNVSDHTAFEALMAVEGVKEHLHSDSKM